MRPLVFHLADNTMVEGLRAFFRRDDWHHALDCARFALDPDSPQDFFKVPGENDQAIWQFADEHLAPFRETHERALVVLDEAFDPSPGATVIQADICRSLTRAGWDRARFEVIVIQPMLEAWLWMESDHVAKAFGCDNYASLRERLLAEGLWQAGNPKPSDLIYLLSRWRFQSRAFDGDLTVLAAGKVQAPAKEADPWEPDRPKMRATSEGHRLRQCRHVNLSAGPGKT